MVSTMLSPNPMWWVALAAVCAIGSGLLVYFIMQSRMQVLLSKQREELAAARAQLTAQKEALRDTIQSTEELTRRKALDEFLADMRVEERHYVREMKMLFMTRKSVVRQERIFFRNIPLTNWVEQEMPYEEGADVEKLARTMEVFDKELLTSPAEGRLRRLLH